MELTLKIHMHQAKNPVKRMIAKIPIIKKTLFYTDGKQPGGMINKGNHAQMALIQVTVVKYYDLPR